MASINRKKPQREIDVELEFFPDMNCHNIINSSKTRLKSPKYNIAEYLG